MKTKILSLILILLTLLTHAQEKENIFPEGDINLVQNMEFGKNTKWAELTATENPISKKALNKLGSFAIADDGKIYLLNLLKNDLSVFDKNGSFIKVLNTDIRDKAYLNSDLRARPKISGILDNKYLVIEIYDRIRLYHLDGTFYKTIVLDYAINNHVVPLSDDLVAISTWIPYKNAKPRNIILLKNIVSEKEHQIMSVEIAPYEKYTIAKIKTTTAKGSFTQAYGMTFPYSRASYIMQKFNNDQLVVGCTQDNFLTVFSKEGRKTKTIDLNINRIKISDDTKGEFITNVKKNLEKITSSKNMKIEKITQNIDDIEFPEYMPYFHSMHIDSDDNILVFLYTENEPKMTAKIYKTTGNNSQELETISTFISPDIKLRINASENRLYFRKNSIFGLENGGSENSPNLRLIQLNY